MGTTVCLRFCIYDYSMFRGFKPGAFKMIKMTMKKCKSFWQIRTSVLQRGCQWCYHWATRQYCIKKIINTNYLLTYFINTYTVFLPRQPLSIRLLHNLRGPPFSPKNKQRLFALSSISILLLWQYCYHSWASLLWKVTSIKR